MKKTAFVWFSGVLFTLVFALAGCGGGGGDGGGGGGGVTYGGKQTQAPLDGTNAEEVATSAYQGGSSGAAIGGLAVQQTVEENRIGRPRYMVVAQTIEGAVRRVDATSDQGNVSKAPVTIPPIPGDCGGTASGSIDLDPVTGKFTGTIDFSNYCSEGVTISGRVNFSGQAILLGGQFAGFQRLDMTFSSLSVRSGNDNFTAANGSISTTFSGNTTKMTVSMLQRNNSTGKVFKTENLSMTITDFVSYAQVVVNSGRMYHPDFGYVDVSTAPSAPLLINSGAEWPHSGELVCIGSSGTEARLTALSSTQYRVIADTDGNGSFTDVGDFDSGPQPWTNL